MLLYNLRTFKRHTLLKEAISKSQNQILSIRFNSFCDALAGEVKYHANCMIHNVDKVLFSGNEDNTRNFENEAKKYAIEEELIQIVGNGIHTGSIFSLKDMYVSYMDALRDSNIVELRTEKTIKKYLKKMLTEEIDDIVFEKSVQRNQSERVFSSSFSSYLLDAAVCKILDDTSGNMRKISVASSIARAASLNTIRKAEKHFSTSQHVHETEVPVELFNLIRWTLGGFKDLYGKRDTKVDTIAKNICNNILYNVKTDRQVSYKSVDGGNSNSNFRHTYENAQVIGHGLTARQFGRRKGLVNLLHEKGESISNDRCLRIETGIANEIIKSIDERGFYLPPNAKKSRIVQFHLDNCNIHEDTDDGKNITNALLLVGTQYCNDNSKNPYLIPRTNTKTLLPNNFDKLKECAPPAIKDFKCSGSWNDFACYQNVSQFDDTLQGCMRPWLMVKSLETGIPKVLCSMQQKTICIREENEILIEYDEENLDLPSDTIDCSSTSDEIDFLISDISNHETYDSPNIKHSSLKDSVNLKESNTSDGTIKVNLCDSNYHDHRKCFTVDTISAMSSAITSLDKLHLPSYSAYNSVLQYESGNYKQTANTLMFPLIPGPADDYSAIYTGFMLAQNVTTHLCGGKTIITLDLDLYERALKLRNSKSDLMQNFILRLGELHIVFAQVRAIGRFCESTGIDDAWLKSNLIGPTTVKQVLTCSHMKRALIIHEATLLALYEIYIRSVVTEFPQIFVDGKDSLLEVTVLLNTCIGSNNLDDIYYLHEKVKLHLNHVDGILRKFDTDRECNFQYRMIKTYINMVERLFVFIHATRSKDWKLHLSSAEELMRDLCSMDRIKYRRLLPVYLAEMYGLEKSDAVVWKSFCDGEFAVQVRPIPFVALGMDHKGEQINRQLKIEGGLIGISRNDNARVRFMLTAPILGQISESFKAAYTERKESDKHHQFTKAYTNRQNNMKAKLTEVLETYHVDFDQKEDKTIRNFVTNHIYPDDIQKDILRVETVGDETYKKVVEERLSKIGEDANSNTLKGLWDPINRLNLKMANNASKKRFIKVNQQVVEAKSHRDFFGRCALIANSKRDFDMKHVIGNYELDPVPRSLMTSDGLLHDGHSNKHQLIVYITKEYTVHVAEPAQDVKLTPGYKGKKTIIVDAMVVVQSVANNKKQKRFKTCKDFADKFWDKVEHIVSGHDEIRIVFDNYQELSLKTRTREERGKTSHSHRFVIEDHTKIGMDMKEFLSDIATKRDFTIYLAEICKLHMMSMGVSYLISVDSKTFGDIDAPNEHNHEEADTLVIWHCLHASSTSDDKDHVIIVYSSDTDVACGLVHFEDQIQAHVYMKTQVRYLNISSIAESLSSKAKALISVHALSGCDTTGSFGNGRNKKGKKKWMKLFEECDADSITALESLQSENPLQFIDTLEKMLCKLYCPTIELRSLSEARWHMYRRNVAQCENLPPTSGAFKQAVLRAAYQIRVWALSDSHFRVLPEPQMHGWEIIDGSYIAVTSEEEVAPQSILNLFLCGCIKMNCCSGHCNCYKNKLRCTSLCKCSENCENDDNAKFVLDTELEDDDVFEDMLT